MSKKESRGCSVPYIFGMEEDKVYEVMNETYLNEYAKTIVQVCFTVGTEEENNVIIEKLKAMKDQLEKQYGEAYIVESCHLPRKIVEEKGFSTQIVDAFDEIFGDKYACQVHADTFEEAMKNMDKYREALSLKADKLFIVSEQKINGVALELNLFTHNKVQVF